MINSTRTNAQFQKRLAKRHRANRRFRLYGMGAVLVSLLFLGTLLVSIVSKGYTAFWQNQIQLPIYFNIETLDPQGTGDAEVIARGDFNALIRESLKASFPEVAGRIELLQLYALISKGAAYSLSDRLKEHPEYIGTTQRVWLTASSDVDMFMKGRISRKTPQEVRHMKDNQIAWVDALAKAGAVRSVFNTTFFTEADSREPELAGIRGSFIGSLLTVLTCILLALPLGVLTAIYLEEFAPKNRLTELIEVNINNLAAVPSIVFGLLGLAVYLSFFGLPRSASLVGGLTLALMVLPTMVITTRLALRAVPPSIRDGARAMGASPLQVVLHHTLPLSVPGMMTGAILSIARALGETAPLLMIGMVAFIADVPSNFLSPATVLPVQIYLWADSPELAFVERTSAGIIILIALLIMLNMVAVVIRRKYERRW